MTSTPNAPETAHADQKELEQASPAPASEAAAPDTPDKTPAFNPFSPETYAPKKNGDTPWHLRNNKSNHDKRPHTPPRGTRRSMGKR